MWQAGFSALRFMTGRSLKVLAWLPNGSDWELPRGQVPRALIMKKGDGRQLSALNSQKRPASLNTEARRGSSLHILSMRASVSKVKSLHI